MKNWGVENVISVAFKKEIKRITYVSADDVVEEYVEWFPPLKHKLHSEKLIRESGISHTIFSPTSSMEALPMFVMGGKAGVLGKQSKPYHWFAGDDLGRMVSTAYQLPEAVNEKFFIHGPEGICLYEALDSRLTRGWG